jgi:hypothetical protein
MNLRALWLTENVPWVVSFLSLLAMMMYPQGFSIRITAALNQIGQYAYTKNHDPEKTENSHCNTG